MAANITAQRKRIEREIDKLRKQQEALLAKEKKPVIAQIVANMREYNIPPEEIIQAYEKGAKRSRPAADGSQPKKPATKGRKGAVVPPKYRNPETGETWTGRGRSPRWLVEAESAGKVRADFEISQNPVQPESDTDEKEVSTAVQASAA